ncbi:MAG: 50S ribosomal protein L33 [Coprobacillus sp.]|nr:50S ribosomal protein L33 [Coprobacillus sp.]
MAGKSKAKQDRIAITLKCTECGEENYLTSKNKKHNSERIEMKKYCPRCQKKTLHREKK